MVLTILLILFILTIIYLLWVPIVLCIDTTTNQYYIQLKGLAKAKIESHQDELLQVKLRVLFFTFQFYPLREIGRTKKKKPSKRRRKKPSKRKDFRTVLRLLTSFKVKKFFVNIDTGDCIVNAKLYPVAALVNYRIGNFRINFQGRNQLVLYLQNRPIDIIRSFINI